MHFDYHFCLIKETFLNLIKRALKKKYKNEGTLYVACNDEKAFFTSTDHRVYTLWSCQNAMGTNCAPLVADLFLFCYETDFMISLSDDNKADVIEAFNSTSRYSDDFLNIDNPYFEGMVNQMYPPELQLNKANTSDTGAPF